MKIFSIRKIIRTSFILAALILIGGHNANAQGTAFTYQGWLYDGEQTANGSYDIAFMLYDATTNGTLLGAQTNNAVAVTNSTFTVTLDFGNVFDGGNRWLELDVRTNGASSFTTLTPRQPITSAPYAIYAENANSAATANSVAATNISGTVSLTQLPAVVLTNNQANVNLVGTFAGNGSGLTNLPSNAFSWQTVSGTIQQATVNTGYLATNDFQVTITLPASPNSGDIVRVSGSGTNGWKVAQNSGQFISIGSIPGDTRLTWTPHQTNQSWQGVASSSDGAKLAAVAYGGQIYTSTDSGVTWTARDSNRIWYTVASSSDGTKLVAGVYNGQLYTSTDSGATWTARDSSRSWWAAASSSDGTKLVAVPSLGQIYTSTDSGVTWTPRDSSRLWRAVTSSSDGTKLAAVVSSGQIYTSTDSGVTWTPRDSNRSWTKVASSADGSKLVALASSIYTSTDSGVTWTVQNTNTFAWNCVACSSDGTKLTAGVYGGLLYTSTNSGVTWVAQNSGTQDWNFIATSSDGSKTVAVVNNGQIYTSGISTTTTTGTAGYLSGTQNSAVELQYIGGSQWMPISYIGTVQGF